jgi:hypothetical protein
MHHPCLLCKSSTAHPAQLRSSKNLLLPLLPLLLPLLPLLPPPPLLPLLPPPPLLPLLCVYRPARSLALPWLKQRRHCLMTTRQSKVPLPQQSALQLC